MCDDARFCLKCEMMKPSFEFAMKTATQVHSYCKPCVRKYSAERYRANPAPTRSRIDKKKSKLRKLLETLKDEAPCMDCNVQYPYYVMDLDHRDSKTKVLAVSVLANNGVSEATLREEIAKCDLVCANCHRKRTYNRARHVDP